MKRILDHDPLTGITTWFHGGEGNDFGIQHVQDCTPFIEHNKLLQGSGKDYWKAGGDWRHEATIPIGVQYEWLIKHGVDVWNPDHQEGVKRLLNDPDWRYLKTSGIII